MTEIQYNEWTASYLVQFKKERKLASYLVTLKCALTSPHLSQSSPVIRYMLTSPLTSLAMAGVTPVPGDTEYTIGRSSSLRICMADHVASFPINLCQIITDLIANMKSIPLIHGLFHLSPSHHQTHNHVSLQGKY